MKQINSFGRRKGRKLSKTQLNLLAQIKTESENQSHLISSREVTYYLEIGFGDGIRLCQEAKLKPWINFIGCEPYLNGLASCIKTKADYQLNNLNIFGEDARRFLIRSSYLFNKIYILYPDPWPKLRQKKRRIISNSTLKLLSDKMTNQAKLIIATDHDDYANWILDHIIKSNLFDYKSKNLEDYKIFPIDWIKTKYQLKAQIQNIGSYYFELIKS